MKFLVSVCVAVLVLSSTSVFGQWVVTEPPQSEGRALAIDAQGRIYVATQGFGGPGFVVGYRPGGVQLWSTTFAEGSAQAIAVDNAGGVYVTGTTGTMIKTVKLNALTGVVGWTATYGSFGLALQSRIVVAHGSVYIAATVGSNQSSTEIHTIRYDAFTGAQSPPQTFNNGTLNFPDIAFAIATDILDNVVVVGSSQKGSLDTDYVTLVYDFDLVVLVAGWPQFYNGGAVPDSIDQAFAVTTTENSTSNVRIYVTGMSYSTNSNHGNDYLTLCYDLNGSQCWSQPQRWHGGFGNDIPYAIVVDPHCRKVFVTGESTASSVGGSRASTISYNMNTGAVIWVNNLTPTGSPPPKTSSGRAIALDQFGDVYIAGQIAALGLYPDMMAAKLSGVNGTNLWQQQYNGSGNHQDWANAVAIDPSGFAVITGMSTNLVYAMEATTIKYTQKCLLGHPDCGFWTRRTIP